MSIGPEGDIYLRARIKLASEENFKNSGVMVLSRASSSRASSAEPARYPNRAMRSMTARR